ncbi:hypothetical protein K0U07_02780, partial [bacterium]|nr:hypothetical protein [bacterium]
MKKLLFFIFLIALFVCGLYFYPNVLPKNAKRIAIDYYTKELPGNITYKEIQITDAFHLKLKGVTWKHEHVELRLPEVTINNSIFGMVGGEEIPCTTKKGRLYYKG